MGAGDGLGVGEGEGGGSALGAGPAPQPSTSRPEQVTATAVSRGCLRMTHPLRCESRRWGVNYPAGALATPPGRLWTTGRPDGWISASPLERKLGVRAGQTVFLDRAPEGFVLSAATTTRLPRRIELALTFHTRRRALESRLPQLVARTEPAGAIWVCWPKKAAVRTRASTWTSTTRPYAGSGWPAAWSTSRCVRSTRCGRA